MIITLIDFADELYPASANTTMEELYNQVCSNGLLLEKLLKLYEKEGDMLMKP